MKLSICTKNTALKIIPKKKNDCFIKSPNPRIASVFSESFAISLPGIRHIIKINTKYPTHIVFTLLFLYLKKTFKYKKHDAAYRNNEKGIALDNKQTQAIMKTQR